MDEALLYIKQGLNHVLDINGYDHILFLIVLAAIYSWSDWKKVLLMVTFFTLGHTATLFLAAFGMVSVESSIIEFLIPLTIFITAVINIVLSKRKNVQFETKLNYFSAFFFGLIHGLGFSGFFKMLMDDDESIVLPLVNFAIGIELAQIIIVIAILILGFLFQNIFRVAKRDWILVVSAIVIGIVLPMLHERAFW